MTLQRILPSLAIAVALCAAMVHRTVADGPTPAGSNWTQWGGPTRNFMSDAKGLASSWPSGGPKKVWSRPLGEGHSSILVEGDRLYTMYRPAGLLSAVRRSQEEVIVAMDATTGKTIWEHRYAAPTDGVDFSQGAGPHSTPLIVGATLYATSSRRELFALDKSTGKRAVVARFHQGVRRAGPGPRLHLQSTRVRRHRHRHRRRHQSGGRGLQSEDGRDGVDAAATARRRRRHRF